MDKDSPARPLAWMATGALVLAAGAFLGAVAGRRKDQAAAPEGVSGSDADALADLADRPVAQAALAESLAAARQVESLVKTVQALEARVHSIERASPGEQVEAAWQRLQHLEVRFDQARAQRAEPLSLESVVAQVEDRLAPRLHALEGRVEEHQAAIQQLQAHAVQTDGNLQKMIAAVEKLTHQISRVLPSRTEAKKETNSAGPAVESASEASVSVERPTPVRRKSLASL